MVAWAPTVGAHQGPYPLWAEAWVRQDHAERREPRLATALGISDKCVYAYMCVYIHGCVYTYTSIYIYIYIFIYAWFLSIHGPQVLPSSSFFQVYETYWELLRPLQYPRWVMRPPSVGCTCFHLGGKGAERGRLVCQSHPCDLRLLNLQVATQKGTPVCICQDLFKGRPKTGPGV